MDTHKPERKNLEDKLYHEETPTAFMRYYLEYSPYGDLETLKQRYKAFNKYLPELFLWHLFNSLAKAALVLEQDTLFWKPCFVVHHDIKPSNILLGYEATKSRDHNVTGGLDGEAVGYPCIKLGDFGIADLIEGDNPQTMRAIGRVGTMGYLAPVSFHTPYVASTLKFVGNNAQSTRRSGPTDPVRGKLEATG